MFRPRRLQLTFQAPLRRLRDFHRVNNPHYRCYNPECRHTITDTIDGLEDGYALEATRVV